MFYTEIVSDVPGTQSVEVRAYFQKLVEKMYEADRKARTASAKYRKLSEEIEEKAKRETHGVYDINARLRQEQMEKHTRNEDGKTLAKLYNQYKFYTSEVERISNYLQGLLAARRLSGVIDIKIDQ